MRILLLLLLTGFVAACTSGPIEGQSATETTTCYLSHGTADCTSRPDIAAMSQAQLPKTYKAEPWVNNHPDKRPLIGLALMGGGSQAGGFALGVLKRLVDEGTIYDIDVLSSVSGGGYAALYLYSRAVYAHRVTQHVVERDNADVFRKTLKSLFDDRFEYCFGRTEAEDNESAQAVGQFKIRTMDWARATDTASMVRGQLGNEAGCGPVTLWNPHSRQDEVVEWDETCQHAAASVAAIGGASMMFSRCHQDIFASGFSKSTRTNQPGNGTRLGTEFVKSVLSAPLYWATNVAFDTRFQSTPSRLTYRTGIYRAFGYVPECWLELAASKAFDPNNVACGPSAFAMRTHGDYLDDSYALKFESLQPLSTADKKRRLPMWVVNATTPTRPFWDIRDSDPAYMDRYRFEFTPVGFGGHRHGFVAKSPTELDVDVMTALLASAGFLDIAQRVKGPALNGAGLVFGNLLNADWSTALPNYRLSAAARTAISAIPAPFHALTRLDEANMRAKIHLGDGGISRDTFGAVALIERGVHHIFISDHVDDKAVTGSAKNTSVKMQVFCELSQMLEKKNLRMVFRGRPDREPDSNDAIYNSDQYCPSAGAADSKGGLLLPVDASQPAGATSRLDYRNWKRPLWVGTIECIAQSPCPEIVKGITLYLMKTAIDVKPDFQAPRTVKNNLGEEIACKSKTLPWVRARCRNLDSDYAASSSEPRSLPPPILLGWWHDGATAPRGGNANDHSLFPQDPMDVMTADNSQSLFAAYLELGNHLAGAISAQIEKIARPKAP